MKKQKIVLQRVNGPSNDDDLVRYTVKSLTNLMQPVVGTKLTTAQAKLFVENRQIEVQILEPK